MKKNVIKKLAEVSFKNDEVDQDKVKKIANLLKREDLKLYIKNLKIINDKRSVQVTIPGDEGFIEIKRYFTKLYPNKRVVFNIDPTLLTGVKVVDYDNIYELSLRGFLEGATRNTND